MHTKQTGNVAELSVAAEIAKQGYPVFKEYGDLSRIDIITVIENKTYKIQVKHGISMPDVAGAVFFSLKKSGPNGYNFSYDKDVVDLFAVYIAEINKVCFIPWKTISSTHTVNIRYLKSKNNQKSSVKWYEDYLDIKQVLGV